MTIGNDLPRDAIEALEQGNLIEAIRCVRTATGTGLKEAKDAVDRYIASRPNLAQRLHETQAQHRHVVIRWLLLIVAAAAALAYYLHAGGR